MHDRDGFDLRPGAELRSGRRNGGLGLHDRDGFDLRPVVRETWNSLALACTIKYRRAAPRYQLVRETWNSLALACTIKYRRAAPRYQLVRETWNSRSRRGASSRAMTSFTPRRTVITRLRLVQTRRIISRHDFVHTPPNGDHQVALGPDAAHHLSQVHRRWASTWAVAATALRQPARLP
ncbi:hypothetical protein [Mycobacterium tuberculosis]|uniref:hypothetical protein n=1 Tax=Mycobacterium tuberculosis TaxID=1773 RepID=UPI002729E06D|nr:hypothetical protein [Mycobacterium tuberculosis]